MSELLDQIEARADAATQGPWEWHPYMGSGATLAKPNHPFHELNILKTTDDWPPVAADAEFIAHAREDLPRLLAAVRAVEAVHEPIDALNVRINRIQKVCTGCGTDDGNWQVWPCPTIRAITEALEGER